MKKIAIEKARERIARATRALDRLNGSKDMAAFAEAWSEFLTAVNSVGHILESGAKSDPRSRQWYGGKKKVARADPLVRYCHEARNADEHGIEPVVEHSDYRFRVIKDGEIIHESPIHESSTEPIDCSGTKTSLFFEVVFPGAKLVAVTNDHFGKVEVFEPPRSHLGNPIDHDSPYGVGWLWLEYIKQLVDDAEALTKPKA